ncbi:hypothetical protein FRC07_014082 [Ceratobasidium sp. 392]|nr:hypothetical protein FRC07_014082 [Ceratobasidium sp. 392]
MARDAVKVLKLIRKAAYQKFHTLSGKAAYPRWLKRVLRHMSGWFESHDASHDSGRLVIEDNRVPMDIITSQMLAWLINHCEDSRSVNVALQAIAGSNNSLPHAPLAECKALDLAVSRLQCRTKLDPAFNTLSPKELSLFHAVSRYASACVILMSGDSYKTDVDRWSCYSEKAGRALDSRYAAAVYSTYTNLLNVASSQSSTSEIFEIAASAAMPLCHWTQGVPQENTALDNALDIVTSVLDRHFQEGGTVLSTSMLHTLAESSVHHLVGRWPREQLHESHELLPVLLSCVVASCFNTAPDTARAAIVSLVAGAFASHTHLGGEIPSNSQDNREKRAVGVLKYYQTNEPDKDQVWALFTFGFFSWLPWFISNDHSAQLATVASHLDRITLSDGTGDQRILDKTIKSMPERFSLAEHAIKPVSDYLLATADNTHGAEMPIMTCALLFFRDPHFNGSHLGVYLIALIALCHTESREHQELCIQAIARQDIRHSPVHNLTSIGGTNLLGLLYRNLLETNKTIAPFIVTHFGLLISCVISDQTNPLSECQSALRPLLNIRDDSSDRNDLDRSLRLRDMVSHLEETINGMTSIATSLERIVQSIAKFCDAGLSQAPGSGVESMVAARNLKQRQMSLKQNCQFYLEKLVGVGVDGPGGSSQPIGTENIRGDAAGSPGTIEGAEKTTKQDK